MNILKDLFKSKGIKRNLSALLSVIFAGVISQPEYAPLAPLLLKIVATLGGVGLVQAAATGNLAIKKEEERFDE